MRIQNVAPCDMNVVVQLGSAVVSITAEGVSYNPTIARDMQDRAISMLREVLSEAAQYGVPLAVGDGGYDDDEDDDVEDEDG